MPEDGEELLIVDLLRVEDDEDRLRVAGAAGGDLFVGRILRVSSRVADGGGEDAL